MTTAPFIDQDRKNIFTLHGVKYFLCFLLLACHLLSYGSRRDSTEWKTFNKDSFMVHFGHDTTSVKVINLFYDMRGKAFNRMRYAVLIPVLPLAGHGLDVLIPDKVTVENGRHAFRFVGYFVSAAFLVPMQIVQTGRLIRYSRKRLYFTLIDYQKGQPLLWYVEEGL